MSLPTSAQLKFSDINGSLRFTNGNVGIGTTSPSFLLDVNGTAKATTYTGANISISGNITTGTFAATTYTGANVSISGNITSATIVGSNYTGANLSISGAITSASAFTTNVNATNISAAALITSTGITGANSLFTNITSAGIRGTNMNVTTLTSANYTLPQNLSATNITVNNILVSTGSIIASYNSHTIGNIFTTGGNVGIGTTAPSTKLHIYDSVNPAGFVMDKNDTRTTIQTWDNGNNKSTTMLGNNTYWNSNGDVILHNASYIGWNMGMGSINDSFSLNRVTGTNTFTNKFTITSSGNVGIGTSTPEAGLHVAGSIANSPTVAGVHMGIDASGYAGIQLNSNAVGGGSYIDFSSSGNDTLARIITWSDKSMEFDNSGVKVTLQTGGLLMYAVFIPITDATYDLGSGTYRWRAFWAANGTINTSDDTLKDCKDLTYGLTDLMKIKTIKYKWKNEQDEKIKDFEYYGFLAENLREIFPELVYDEDPNAPLQVNYSEILPITTNAIKELNNELKETKSELIEFKQMISSKYPGEVTW